MVAKNENRYLQNRSNLPSVPLLSKAFERLLTEMVTYINNDHRPKAKAKALNPKNTHKHISAASKITINMSVTYLMLYNFNLKFSDHNNQLVQIHRR